MSTLADFLELLKNDKTHSTLYDAAKPYLTPLLRMGWNHARIVLENLKKKRFQEAYADIYNACDSFDELRAVQRASARKKLEGALQAYEQNEETKELAMKLVSAIIMAGLMAL